jgi:hypothetical protein
MLTQHPDIERRLREEIFAKVGPTESPTYEQIREMKFMRAFLNGIDFQSTLSYSNADKKSICVRGSEALPSCVRLASSC